MIFGSRLKALREELNLTQHELAAKLALVPSTVSQYESNKRMPDTQTIQRIAELFDCSTDYLLGRSQYRDLPANAFPADNMVKIPVVGKIRAGEPILVVENILDYEYVQEDIVKNGDYFFLRVEGDSMVDARIHPGDLVLIRRQSEVENGQIAAVLIGEEATLKRVYRQNGHLILQAANPKYPPVSLSSGDVQIVGKIVRVVFSME